MTTHWRSRLAIVLLALMCSVPLWASWTSLGSMPAPRRLSNGVEYRNQQGIVQITVLKPGIVRVRFAPGSQLGPDHSFALVPDALHWQAPFQFKTSDSGDELKTADLTVRIQRAPFRLTILDGQGHVLAQDTHADGIAYDGHRVRDWQTLDDATHFYGFGEKTGVLDKRSSKLGGMSMTMWNSDVYGYDNSVDPLYVDIPFFIRLKDGIASGIFFDNPWRSNFDIGHTSLHDYSFGAEGGDLNYYVIAGPAPRDVLRRYADLTGHIDLPPLWVLGFNQSRYSYYPDTRVLDIASQFRKRHIPADVLWLDIHYMRGYRIFTWDPQRFPHPKQMLDKLAGENFHVVSIIDPGVKKDPNGYAAYDSGVKNDVFVKYPDGKYFVGPVWPGPALFPDFTDAKARQWWAGQIAHLASSGLSGIWIDMNEPSVFNVPSGTMPDDIVFKLDGKPVPEAEVHNVYGQQMSIATRQGLLDLRPNQRPFVLSRDSYAGGQRYAAVWTGDNTADWAHLRDGVTTLLGMGISGFPFVGNDIGGFAGVGSADLWTRWVEAGTFFPFMRAHAELQAPNKEPWAYGEPWTQYNQRAIERRYQFLPYIYNCFYQTAQDGMPMMRALFLQYPNDPATWNLSDEYLFGNDLLVAPVMQPHTVHRSVYLPKGAWYDYFTGTAFTGGRSYSLHVGEGDIPLFVPDGAILFQAPVMQSTAEWKTAPLVYSVWAKKPTRRIYYEDDGATLDYQKGVWFRRTVSFAPNAGGAEVTLSAAEGTYQPQHRGNRIELHFARKPSRVTLNGVAMAPGSIRFDAARSTLTVTIPQSSKEQRLDVRW